MRLLLDTTYFLPAIGIAVKGVPRDAVVALIERGYEVSMSEISFFELSAKGAKYVAAGVLTPERVTRGIRALLYDNRVGKVPVYDTPILLTAFELRKVLGDFIDCLILSTAINRADVLITEDRELREILSKKAYQDIIRDINPEFEVKRLKDVI
ncbi:hypothetical protein DRO33_03435 [Candidatus Bathyarchaeota archaeon]|nr:MAG: hypothetical protein DRO33_03435 [Candidatus Bathyarchaeota archaeon]